jgi:DNA helicase IV
VRSLTDGLVPERGGTFQAQFERDAMWEQVQQRLARLALGDRSLVFGRLDFDAATGGDRFYIGRFGVWDDAQDAVVVDWRAPAAEPFYRSTASDPLGLERRRHFATRGRTLLGMDDELFGDLSRLDQPGGLQGQGALIAALEEARTGRLGDIVGTIQTEQDEIIRAPMAGVLVVQGGPGTGKTVVALHRAAYLLYTHRFPLEGQGVLVVGPNRLFLSYIEQVLPSLGEAGVELATIGDLVPAVAVDGLDPEPVARVKGDLGMVRLVARAVRCRQLPLREDLVVGHGVESLRLTVDDSARIVAEARRRFRTHNAGRRFVEAEVFAGLAASSRAELDTDLVRQRLGRDPVVREALEWMWPVLTPAELLHDLFGSRSLLKAAGDRLSPEELALLHRPRRAHVDDVVWTTSDAPLLDEARAALGPRPRRKEEDEVRTYGHIVVDEAQGLSPMELRMLERRSLNGSMTIVGDIAQATGAWAHDDWESILEHLPRRHEPQRRELTIGYRIPAPAMTLANRVLREAAPQLRPPIAIRTVGEPPRIVRAEDLLPRLGEVVAEERRAVESGNVSIVVPGSLLVPVSAWLSDHGVDFGRPTRRGLDHQLTLVPVSLIKGLEVDSVIVVEPSRIVGEERQGLRSLYVALTRATRRVTVVHAEPLPDALRE